MTLNVAGGAGVGVTAPGATHAVGLLDDCQVVDASPAQCHCRAEATESVLDDRHPR